MRKLLMLFCVLFVYNLTAQQTQVDTRKLLVRQTAENLGMTTLRGYVYAYDSVYFQPNTANIPFLPTASPVGWVLTTKKGTTAQLVRTTLPQLYDAMMDTVSKAPTSYTTWVRDTTNGTLSPGNLTDTVSIPNVTKFGSSLYAPNIGFQLVPSSVMDVLVKNQYTGLIHTYPLQQFVNTVDTGGVAIWERDSANHVVYLRVLDDNIGIGTTEPKAGLHIHSSIFVRGASGDLDGDGEIFSGDMSIMLQHFGNTDSLNTAEKFVKFDLDGNGEVNLTDMYVLTKLYPSFNPTGAYEDSVRLAAKVIAGSMYGVIDDSTYAIMKHLTVGQDILMNGGDNKIRSGLTDSSGYISIWLRAADNGTITERVTFKDDSTNQEVDFRIISLMTGTASQVLFYNSDNNQITTDVLRPSYGIPILSGQYSSTVPDATTLYWGGVANIIPSTTQGQRPIVIAQPGTITAVSLNIHAATTIGSDESWEIFIEKNGTASTSIGTVATSDLNRIWRTNSLSIAVIAGDVIELKTTTPNWATNPAQLLFGGHIIVSH